jgi:hypothetical protein
MTLYSPYSLVAHLSYLDTLANARYGGNTGISNDMKETICLLLDAMQEMGPFPHPGIMLRVEGDIYIDWLTPGFYGLISCNILPPRDKNPCIVAIGSLTYGPHHLWEAAYKLRNDIVTDKTTKLA